MEAISPKGDDSIRYDGTSAPQQYVVVHRACGVICFLKPLDATKKFTICSMPGHGSGGGGALDLIFLSW
jgi:hypothetical protein